MNVPINIIGLCVFLVLTIIYFIVVYNTSPKHHTIEFIIYVMLLYILQFLSNLLFSKNLCGDVQVQSAFLYTVIPWIIIFGILITILIILPAWLKPFANTIGYLFIKMFGLKSLLNKILKPMDLTTNKQLNADIHKLYDNPSLLINEIPNTEEGFNNFKNEMDDLLNKNADLEKNLNKLKKLIDLKFLISKFIWYVLGGLLTFAVSCNYMIKSSCKLSVKQMENKHTEYERMVKEQEEKEIKPRVYRNYGE